MTLCFDPLKVHKRRVAGTRKCTPEQLLFLKEQNMQIGELICTNCCAKLNSAKKISENVTPQKNNIVDEIKPSPSTAGEMLNTSLTTIGVSPLDKKRSFDRRGKVMVEKVEQAKAKMMTLASTFLLMEEKQTATVCVCNDLIPKLAEKFKHANRQKRMEILTLFVPFFTRKEIKEIFPESTEYQIRQAKQMEKQNGPLEWTKVQQGRPIDPEVAQAINDFYLSDEISYACAGMKETKNGLQKRILHYTITEAVELFKLEHPHIKIGRTKFSELRPRNIVFAGSPGTHNVCVCRKHGNLKLLLYHAGLKATYRELLQKIVCSIDDENCMFDKCQMCPGESGLEAFFETQMPSSEQHDEYVIRQWSADGRSLESLIIHDYSDLKNLIVTQLIDIKSHHFIHVAQSSFYKDVKQSLADDEATCQLDFSENYTFVFQDETPHYFFHKSQATIHPFVFYLKSNQEIICKSYVVISDCLMHKSVTVHCFLKHVLKKFKEDHSNVKKIFYFSDGAGGQYKNKFNFINLLHHEIDFGLKAEWHFFATSHGKGVCDGLGGTLKRCARQAALRNKNLVRTPKELYAWAASSLSDKMEHIFVSEDDVRQTEAALEERYERALPLEGTREFHSFAPLSQTRISVALTSKSQERVEFRISSLPEAYGSINLQIGSFVICDYEGEEYVGQITEIISADDIVVNCMHPAPRTADRWCWPRTPDLCHFEHCELLRSIPDPVPVKSSKSRGTLQYCVR